MKILNCGDQHLTTKKPKNRTDDYYRTALGKFKQELDIAGEEGCSFVILPGDLFESFKEGHLIVQEIIKEIKRHKSITILCVAGQHDQQFHTTNLAGTPIETLIVSGYVKILGAEPFIQDGVAFYGASWDAEIPEISTGVKVSTNILVLHKMIIDDKLWAEQEGHTWANHMLIKTKFDLIVSGDNHKQFTVSKGGKHLVNMGSMLRSTIAQLNHQPAVALYDTQTKELEIINLDFAPFEDVMQIDKANKEKERNLKLEAFVKSLKDKHPEDESELHEGHTIKLDFVKALNDRIEEERVAPEISKIIFDCLGVN